MFRGFLVPCLILIHLGVVGCSVRSGGGDAQTSLTGELSTHRSRWEGLKPSLLGYQFSFSRICYCGGFKKIDLLLGPGDALSSFAAFDFSDQPIPGFDINESLVRRLDDLFDILESAISSGAAKVLVTYDEEFGFPQSIFIDYDESAVDDEISYVVNSFTANQ